MTARAPRLRLATEGGRRVGRTPKVARLAAQPATDAARMGQFLAEVYAEGVHVLAAAMRAEEAVKATLTAAYGADVVTRALAREAHIEVGFSAARLSALLTMIERATGGVPHA